LLCGGLAIVYLVPLAVSTQTSLRGIGGNHCRLLRPVVAVVGVERLSAVVFVNGASPQVLMGACPGMG